MINLDFSVAVTIFYVIVLYVFMNNVFFKPVMQILKRRRELTQGRLQDAQKRLEQVEAKTAEYEQALKNARTETYRRQEMERERALTERAELVARAKSEADKAVQEGRLQLTAAAAA